MRDAGVLEYSSPMAVFPDRLRLSGEGECVPVWIHGARQFAKGGLVEAADKVRGAGRYGDSQLIHVNEEELAELTRMWGDPTINPDTGLPEFFLGGLFKIFKKILPIAASFIPGVGPAIGGALGVSGTAGSAIGSTLLGAATGALAGGGKGALAGAGQGLLGATAANTGTKPTVMPVDTTTPAAAAQGAAQVAAGTPAKVSFWNQKTFGIPNKFAVPLIGGALLLASRGSKDQGEDAGFNGKSSVDDIVGSKFQPVFRGNLGPAQGYYSNLSANTSPIDRAEQYAYGSGPERRFFNYAVGGRVQGGSGDGRADDVPAMLSDGEYVIDAETVALLGDGSNRAGADRLDRMRVEVRKHKGRRLASGAISPNARSPLSYAVGGRT